MGQGTIRNTRAVNTRAVNTAATQRSTSTETPATQDVQATSATTAAENAGTTAPAVTDQMDSAPSHRPQTGPAANTRSGGSGVLPFQIAERLPTAATATVSPAVGQGPDGPPRAEVASLLSTYGAPRLGRPAERVARWGAQVHDRMNAAATAGGGDVSKTVDVMLEKDIRRQVFLLEGGLKFYKKAYPSLEPLLVQAKALEDQLGLVKGTSSMHALAVEKGAPKAVIDVLAHHANTARAALETLVKNEWMPGKDGKIPAIATLVETFAATPWMSYDDDKKFVHKEFGRRLKGIEKVPYDMKQLQGDVGVHELRRNLRWVPIYAEALDGLVQTDPDRNPVKAYKPMLKEEIAESKFMRLPDAEYESKPIGVSKSLYAANMQLVLDFGDLKDRG